MNKVVGAAEFKAKCLAILDEVQATGESVTITKRGKPVAEVKPVEAQSRSEALLGLLRGTVQGSLDPQETGFDTDWESEWEKNNPPELYAKR